MNFDLIPKIGRSTFARFFALCLCFVALNAQAVEVLLANVWNARFDPATYWVSEKLDGVRAVWDGAQLRTRNGHVIQAPAWFVANFPKQDLDGELWIARGQFEAVSGAVNQLIPDDARWREIQYRIFELPNSSGDFSARVSEMQQITRAANVPWLVAVPQFRVANAKTLRQKLHKVVAEGGEGLMLHRADAVYATGRSDDLLKLKLFEDAEARVLAHIAGKGRNAKRLGALEVENAQGKGCRSGGGFYDERRENPPAVGSVVTYRYNGLTKNGTPRFPRFWRIRQPE